MNPCPRCSAPAIENAWPAWECQSGELNGAFMESTLCGDRQKTAEIARLRARIERLTAFCDRLISPNDLGFAVTFEVRQLAHEAKGEK